MLQEDVDECCRRKMHERGRVQVGRFARSVKQSWRSVRL